MVACITRSERTPSELITARCQAFRHGDFGFIYDSYHSDSSFRQQFPSRQGYLHFGRTRLAQEYQIVCYEILAERVRGDQAQVVFLMEVQVHGGLQHYAELAWLRLERNGWRYHRGQKMMEEELPENRQNVSFSDFAKLDPSTIF